MKKFLNIVFVVLGVIFFVLILLGTYIYVADPLNLKPSVTELRSIVPDTPVTETTNTNPNTETVDKNPSLSETQEKTLETFGIDPAALPTSITPEQEACFIEKLGAPRVEEIKAGDTPSIFEIGKARGCL